MFFEYFAKEAYDYLGASIPMILGHLAIPPLSFIYSSEDMPPKLAPFLHFIYSLTPSEFMDKDFVDNLLLRTDTKIFEAKISRVTHIFVHVSYEHVLSNMSAAVSTFFSMILQWLETHLFWILC